MANLFGCSRIPINQFIYMLIFCCITGAGILLMSFFACDKIDLPQHIEAFVWTTKKFIGIRSFWTVEFSICIRCHWLMIWVTHIFHASNYLNLFDDPVFINTWCLFDNVEYIWKMVCWTNRFVFTDLDDYWVQEPGTFKATRPARAWGSTWWASND